MVNNNRQRLLVDTDAYCKLGVAGLFDDAITALGVQVAECGRLAALPYMLRRGSLRRIFGDDASETLLRPAAEMPLAIQPGDGWLDPLTAVDSIDPGEAQLLAASAEYGLLLLTGDKRALRAVKDIPFYAEALDGNGSLFWKQSWLNFAYRLGVDAIRSRILPLMERDIAINICFSASNSSPVAGLLSYYENLAVNVEPLNLWRPSCPGRKMRFGPRHYVPVLKVKRGEKKALASIAPMLRQHVFPLLEIVERKTAESTIDKHLSKGFKDLASSLRGYARCLARCSRDRG